MRVLQEMLRPWCLGGNGGMDDGDCYWGLSTDYYMDSFPHSLLSTRKSSLEFMAASPHVPLESANSKGN